MSADDLTISPPSSSSSPARTRSCVVLPAPLFPTRPTRCPVCTSQLASVSTSWLRNRSWPPLILRYANPGSAPSNRSMRDPIPRRPEVSVPAAAAAAALETKGCLGKSLSQRRRCGAELHHPPV